MSRVAAVVLAAGGSRRLGEPKQLIRLAGELLLDRAVRLARAAGLDPVIVVLGAEGERLQRECALGDAVIVLNPDWVEGMGGSLALGGSAVPPGFGVIVMTCDQPAVTADHLRLLAARDKVTASEYAGRKGVPAYFPANVVESLTHLRGDVGARALLADAGAISLPGGELDIDTAHALAEARRLYS